MIYWAVKKKIKYGSSLLAIRLADRCKALTFSCLGCGDEGPQSQLCSQKPPWPNKHTKIFLWVVMFRDCQSNKRWLSGWQWHLHAATRARAGHNTTVCPNGEVRAQGAGGGGSNSVFVSPLLRAGVTHHHKQGQMTKISWTDQWGKEKWKKKKKKIKPLCLLVHLSSGRWICVLGRKLTSPTNICYILHVS